MKKAICYSGNIRTFHHCVKNHAEMFGECDVYFSLWDTRGFVDRINDPWHTRIEERDESPVTLNTVLDLCPKEFNVRMVKIESYDDVKFDIPLKANNYLLFQYYKIKDCFDMVEDDYDVIVRMRCDITIDSFEIKNGLTCNKYIWYNKKYDGARMNEMIFAGSMEVMAQACDIINNIDYINKSLPDAMIYGESVFNQHLLSIGVPISLHNFGFRVWR